MSKRPSRGVSSGVGSPMRMSGRDGDLTIRKTKEGKILYVKEHGSWHPINTGVDTAQLKKDVDRLIRSVNTLRNDNNPYPTINALNIRKNVATATVDPKITFTVAGSDIYTMGVDTNDTNSFVIANSSALGTTNRFAMTTAGAITLASALGVASGGTGADTLTNGGVLLGSGTGAITATSVLADGEVLIGDGTTDPVALDVGSSTAITILGTVGTGVWEGTAIAAGYVATLNQDTTGTAAEATVLETSRNIFGIGFTGAANVVGDVTVGAASGAKALKGNTTGNLTIRTDNSSGAGSQAKIVLTDGADGDIAFTTNGTGKLTTNSAIISTATAGGATETTVGDTRFLMIKVSDGLIGYRTATELKGDIGTIAATSTFTKITLDPGSDGDVTFEAQGADAADKFTIAVGASGVTTLATVDDGEAVGHLNIEPDGHVEFDNCAVGFDKLAGVFGTSPIDSDANDSTDIDFRLSNKYELELTNNISGSSEYINMVFPATSGNFLLVLSQDGTGSRTVASAGWRVYQADGSTLATNAAFANGTDGAVRWAGGTAPTLTTTADKSDIVSMYWDADNQTCFATITHNF